MSISRKHYVAIAKALNHDAAHLARTNNFDYDLASDWERGAYDQWNTTVLAIGLALQDLGDSFDLNKFMTACEKG